VIDSELIVTEGELSDLATNPIVTNARAKLLTAQEHLDTRRRVDRRWRIGQCVSVLALMVMFSGTAATWHASRFAVGDIACGSVLLITLSVMTYDFTIRRDLQSRRRLEADVSARQEDVHAAADGAYPKVEHRRRLYRQEVADIIEQFQRESRKYRRIHNSLQSLIMVGATATTTVASLNTATDLSWQNVITVAISFAITLAATFTGYYKFRERSYFLRETADAIEEQVNALSLGIGEYKDLDEVKALRQFTIKVEGLRNEQRRRQQQLDQPNQAAAAPAGQAAE
jgi:Protein of unknown function (DUF4231)